MHYIHNDEIKQEQVQFLDENQMLERSWVNVSQAHELRIVKAGFSYYIKVVFSPEEYYYVKSFESEKAASKYLKELMD